MQMTVPRPREQALEQIMAYILENKLSADDKLPPEREMCQMWGVNRCTLRSAIAALTEQGIVYAVQGSGTRIAHRFRRILQDLQGFSEYAAGAGGNGVFMHHPGSGRPGGGVFPLLCAQR